MTDYTAIGHLHSILKHKGRWYIDCSCGDVESLFDICEKAKDNADKRLSELSTLALWSRYKQWRKSDPIVGKEEDLFNAFLNQVCFDLGRDALKRSEVDLYDELCNLKVYFI
jgi:hypothetical protein